MPYTDASLLQREEEIRALQKSGPEKRLMALGPHYRNLQLSPEAFSEVEEKLRVARLFEVTTMSHTMRSVEIDEQRRLVMERRSQEAETSERLLEELHRLRERAYEVLMHDAEAVKLDEQRRLESDRRAVLNIEKSRITEKREQFEASQATIYGGSHHSAHRSATSPAGRELSNASFGRAASPAAGSLYAAGAATSSSLNLPPNPNKAPLLVMNITLGNGREDKLTVRANDDPNRVAVVFAKKHRLPDAAVKNLTTQIRAHLNARVATATSSGAANLTGSIAGGVSMSPSSAYAGVGRGGGGGYSFDSRATSQSPAPSTGGFRSQAGSTPLRR